MPIIVGRNSKLIVKALNRIRVTYLKIETKIFDLTDSKPWPNGSAHASSFGKLKYKRLDFLMSFASHANLRRRSKTRESHDLIIDMMDNARQDMQNMNSPYGMSFKGYPATDKV